MNTTHHQSCIESVNGCPCCGNEHFKIHTYQTGCIFICGLCELQWASRNKEFIPTENLHYHNPKSVFGSKPHDHQYAPYVNFFYVLSTIFYKKSGLRILDIGCGSGAFIKYCLQCGIEAYGVEADTKLSQLMDSETKERVFFGLAENYHIDKDCKFDIITFWDSFEHLPNAFEILTNLEEHLAVGGMIYIRTNNNKDIYNLVTKILLKIFPALGKYVLKFCFHYPDHVWNFSRKAMKLMLEKRGWTIVSHSFDDTPASRLTANIIFKGMIEAAYIVNKAMHWGKIGNYYIQKQC
ncbi:class I SAM-dependent methyltransferase [Desulfovibrio sp. OttesenSCG-928-G11]|nr:class I SAM-dependent methyltransferase [Desulfovibrio sp. OttesenSCG-928-G11]